LFYIKLQITGHHDGREENIPEYDGFDDFVEKQQ